MRNRCLCDWGWIGAVGLICHSCQMAAVEPADFAVQLSAQVQSSPAQIVLQWPGSSFATGYTVSRKLRDDQAWATMATLGGGATAFSDPNVVLGAAYEYEVAETTVDGINAYGYIYAGTEVPFPQ